MGTFEENARPDPRAVAQIFGVLRSEEQPLAPDILSAYLDLMLLPLLKGLASTDERVARLRLALDAAGPELTDEHQFLYRKLLVEPDPCRPHKRWGPTRDAFNAQPSRRGNEITEGTVRKHAQKMYESLAKILLDPDFAALLDEQHPIKRKDSSRSTPTFPPDAYELLEYDWSLDISDDDPRKHQERLKVKVRMALPHQRILGLRYYSNRVPGTPESDGVTITDPHQKYLGTFPDFLEASPSKWWMHFIHLGGRMPIGAEVAVEMQERYFDEGEGESSPYLTRLVRSSTHRSLALAIRLPSDRLSEVEPKARVVRDPYDQPELVDEWPLKVSREGWVREDFSDLKVHMQYGIFLPDFDLYK